jgi:dienelactone hydrolase
MNLKPSLQGLLILAACISLPSILLAQKIEVTPNRILLDESAAIHVTGLQPKERVVIQASLVDGGGQSWASRASFIADEQGNVDVSTRAPVEGSYKEISAMGLIWSMRPTGKNVTIYRPPANLAHQSIQFQLIRNGAPAGTAELQQLRVGEGVRGVRVSGKLHGMLFLPNASGRHPGVLVVGGSEGGQPMLKAAWLASHGFAALALAYFRFEDLPATLEGIPLEYFGLALSWMAERPEINPEQLAVLGTSRGGELALQLGSMYPQIHSVVAYVPADVRYPACCGNTAVPYAWTWQGRPLAFATLNPLRIPAEARIKVEQTHGPILLISGEDDGIWRSSTMADSVAAELKHAKFPYRVEHLKYAHAGHGAGMPQIIPMWHGLERHPISGREIDPGGSIQGNAASSIDAAPRVLQFLQQSFEGASPAQAH